MSLYARQKKYFEAAYAAGVHGWPTAEPTPFVVSAVRRLLRTGKLAPADRVLDVGCGEGRHTFACAAMGLRTVGLDYQMRALERARRMPPASRLRRRTGFVAGDVFSLPFGAERFGMLIDYGCLHHVRKRDTRRYLDSVSRLISPGGYFLLSCFSWRFKHHPGERRTRDWIVHRDHYDRFFHKKDFSEIFGGRFDVIQVREEREGIRGFYHVLMRRKPAGGNLRDA